MKINTMLTYFALFSLSMIGQSLSAATDSGRDPHAYSGGYTLTDGPYAQDGPRQLKLADEHIFKSFFANRFEYDVENKLALFEFQGWVGSTYDRFVFKAEGDIEDTDIEESKVDLLWSHAFNPYWNSQLGVRADASTAGEDRQWFAFGIQGLAPYWFEVDMTGFIGTEGRTAATLALEYELLFTQKIILQPSVAFEINGKNDEINGIGRGLSSADVGLRLRYEYTRQFAPYIGIERHTRFGQTADYARNSGDSKGETIYVAGVRFWL